MGPHAIFLIPDWWPGYIAMYNKHLFFTLVPYSRFGALYEHDLTLFEHILLGTSSLEEYWLRNAGTTWFKEHPLLSRLSMAELLRVIPIELHGDDAELHKRRSFSISTVSSALTSGATWEHKLLLSCFDNSSAGDSTASEIDSWHCWGVVCAMAGVYLDHDWYGRKFDENYFPELYAKAGSKVAGDFRFVFAGHKGDQVYLHKCYKFENYWTGQQVCRSCADSRQP